MGRRNQGMATPACSVALNPSGGDQAVTQHCRLHRFRIGRRVGYQRCHFAEISGAEHPGCENVQTGRLFA